MYRYILNNDLIVPDAPMGWESKRFVLSRSETYDGIFLTVSADLQFIREAFTYLQNMENETGIASECTIEIQRYINNTGDWKTEFYGVLDFSEKIVSAADGKTISFKIVSDSFSDKITNRESIEIPYDRLETLDGQEIQPFENEYYELSVLGQDIITTANLAFKVERLNVPNMGYVDHIWPTIGTESNNGNILNTLLTGNCNYQNFDSSIFSYYADGVNAVINIKLLLTYFYLTPNIASAPSSFSVKMAQKIPYGEDSNEYGKNIYTDTIQTLFAQTIYAVSGVPVYNNIDLDKNFEIPEGYGLYFEFSRVEVDCLGGYMEITSNELCRLTISERAPETPCKMVPPFEALTRIIEAYTGESLAVYSEFFGRENSPVIYDDNGKGSLLFCTNGMLLRQFEPGHIQNEDDDENKVAQLSFSLNSFFDNYNKIYNIGAGVEFDGERYFLRVEDKKYFYQEDIILTIENSVIQDGSFERVRNTSMFFNAYNIGYNYEQPEEVSGNLEFNINSEFSSPIKNTEQLFDIVCDYIASGFLIEFTRREVLTDTETNDYRYDNNNFVFKVYVEDGEYIQQTTQEFIEINGIDLITTPCNLDITPARNFIKNWGWYIKASLQKFTGKHIVFNTSKYTTNLSTKKEDTSLLIKENSNIDIDILETPLFSGDIFRLSAPISGDTFNLIKQNPYKIFKVWDEIKGDYSFGWIKEVSTEPVDRSTNWEFIEANSYHLAPPRRLINEGYRLLDDGSFRLINS